MRIVKLDFPGVFGAFSLLIFVAMSTFAPVVRADDVKWRPSLEKALAEAKRTGRPVFVAVNKDGEPVCDKLAKKHYHDPKITKRCEHFVCLVSSPDDHTAGKGGTCPRFGTVTCAEHMAVERALRGKHLPEGKVDVPQHLFLTSAGKLHLTKLWYLSVDELDTLLVSVLRKFRPEVLGDEKSKDAASAAEKDGGKKPTDGAKAGDDEKAGDEKKEPETPAEIRAAILASSDTYEIKKLGRRLVRAKDDESREILRVLLADKKFGDRRAGLLLAYGFREHTKGVGVVAPFLKDKSVTLRSHAAVALEDIGHKSALKPLQTQWKKEKAPKVRKNLLRALGRCAKKKSSIAVLIVKATRDPSQLVRRNAFVALGNFPKNKKAENALFQATFYNRNAGGGRGGGGGGGRGGRGGRNNQRRDAFRDRQTERLAAALGLGQTRSAKAKKQVKRDLRNNKNPLYVALLEALQRDLDGDIDHRSAGYINERRRLASDEIWRDTDPRPEPKKDEEKDDKKDDKKDEDGKKSDEKGRDNKDADDEKPRRRRRRPVGDNVVRG